MGAKRDHLRNKKVHESTKMGPIFNRNGTKNGPSGTKRDQNGPKQKEYQERDFKRDHLGTKNARKKETKKVPKKELKRYQKRELKRYQKREPKGTIKALKRYQKATKQTKGTHKPSNNGINLSNKTCF